MTDDWQRPDDEDVEDEEEITPDDPDWDLSEAHGYRWDPERPHWPVPPAVLAAVSVLVILALVLPGVLLILR
jgi:hypothetical protein